MYMFVYCMCIYIYICVCVCWGLVPLASQPMAGIIQVEFEVFTCASKRCTNEGGINVLLLHYVIALCCIYSILLIIYVQTCPNVYTHTHTPLVVATNHCEQWTSEGLHLRRRYPAMQHHHLEKRTSSISWQGLVNVPFWEYWTSPKIVAIINHIPNGWVM